MKQAKGKTARSGNSERPSQGLSPETIHGTIIAQSAKNTSGILGPCMGALDTSGRFPVMPVYDMPEETPAAWNAKVERMRRRLLERA